VDVHAPHHAISGWKDFLIHLVTITVGLMIAVGIEGCVELHREHTLVNEARATMHDEIAFNAKKMQEHVAELDADEATMRKNLEVLKNIQEHPKDKAAQNGSLDGHVSATSLRDTAWKTAQATNALSYMPYEEAQKYADLYESQAAFLKAQEVLLEDDAQMFGAMRKTDFGHGDITPEQAGMVAERFGAWQIHLTYLHVLAKATAMADKAFLEGKEAPTEMHEEIKE
jgi:hypothetical protein